MPGVPSLSRREAIRLGGAGFSAGIAGCLTTTGPLTDDDVGRRSGSLSMTEVSDLRERLRSAITLEDGPFHTLVTDVIEGGTTVTDTESPIVKGAHVLYEGTVYRITYETNWSGDVDERTYEYVADSVTTIDEYPAYVRESFVFELADLAPPAEAVIETAVHQREYTETQNGDRLGDESDTPTEGFRSVLARLASHDPVPVPLESDPEHLSYETYRRPYLPRYNGDIYWTRVAGDREVFEVLQYG